MPESISHAHHYVPRWYQKRFLPPGQTKLYYLDLKPETVVGETFRYTKKAVRFLDPALCFCVSDLYSMRFGRHVTDTLEQHFFGAVDRLGAPAAEFFNSFNAIRTGINKFYQDFLAYIAAQRFRTLRGLDWIKRQAGAPDQTRTLIAMRELFQLYNAMWMEGVWELVHARNSARKFIVSDNPVTFYNRRIFPHEDAYPGGDDFPKVGTRTIFPVSMDCCLIITHLQLVRNPWSKPLAIRENARMFGQTMAKLTAIQVGRELEEDEVLRINYILKQRATKFIAAPNREALCPENQFAKTDWSKLDDDWFLLPNPWKVGFTTGIVAGFKDGSTLAVDEYGRSPRHPRFEDGRRREAEHRTFENGRREWAKRRIGKSLAHTLDLGREDAFSDRFMREYLQQEGLLPPDETTPNT